MTMTKKTFLITFYIIGIVCYLISTIGCLYIVHKANNIPLWVSYCLLYTGIHSIALIIKGIIQEKKHEKDRLA